MIVDWVPAHFPKDAHGLVFFDGTALYEHADPRKGEHRDWGTLVFNYGRNEVRVVPHLQRAVLAEGVPHRRPARGRRGLHAVPGLLAQGRRVDPQPVRRQREPGGHRLPPPLQRAGAHRARRLHRGRGVHRLPGRLQARLPQRPRLHHEVEHGLDARHAGLLQPTTRSTASTTTTTSPSACSTPSPRTSCCPSRTTRWSTARRSLLNKMPGDEWQQFANARAFLAYMWAHPGKKLLFMGQEIGQREEWNHDSGIRWELLEFDLHRKLQALVRELNRLYRANPALYQVDFHYSGFEWVDFHDGENSIIAFLRRAEDPKDFILFCCNFTPVPRKGYEFGVPEEGFYQEILNTDSELFGGTNLGNGGWSRRAPSPRHNRPHSHRGDAAAARGGGVQEAVSHGREIRRHHRRRRPQRPGRRGVPGARRTQGAGAGAPRAGGRLRRHRRDLARLPRLHRRLPHQPAAGAHRPRTGAGALRLPGGRQGPRLLLRLPRRPPLLHVAGPRAARWPRSPNSHSAMPRSIPRTKTSWSASRGWWKTCC